MTRAAARAARAHVRPTRLATGTSSSSRNRRAKRRAPGGRVSGRRRRTTSRSDVLEGELARDRVLRGLFAVDLAVRVDEVVERLPLLLRHEVDVAAGGDLDAIDGQPAEVELDHVGARVGDLVGLADVDRHPAAAVGEELGPAVVPGDLALGLVARE